VLFSFLSTKAAITSLQPRLNVILLEAAHSLSLELFGTAVWNKLAVWIKTHWLSWSHPLFLPRSLKAQ